MTTSAAGILAEVRMKREVREFDVEFRHYWKTYALTALYVAAFAAFEYGLKQHVSALLYFIATLIILGRALRDSQTAANRRFGALVELLEKKNLL